MRPRAQAHAQALQRKLAKFLALHVRQPALDNRNILNWKGKILNLAPDLVTKEL